MGNAERLVEDELNVFEFVDGPSVGFGTAVVSRRAGVGTASVGEKALALGGNGKALGVKLAASVGGNKLGQHDGMTVAMVP